MGGSRRDTDIDVGGKVDWGSHFCEFYHGKEELAPLLVDCTNGLPLALPYLDFVVEGNVLTVTTSTDNMPVVAGWFSETLIDYGPPWPLDEYGPMGDGSRRTSRILRGPFPSTGRGS